MKYISKYLILRVVFVFIVFIVFFNINISAKADDCSAGTQKYCLLAPIGDAKSINVTDGFGVYAAEMIRIFVGILCTLGVVMFIWGGIQYMSPGSSENKTNGLLRIKNTIYGLLLVLGSYTLLYTINPKLVNLGVSVPSVVLTLMSEPRSSISTPEGGPTGPADVSKVYCPHSGGRAEIAKIAASMVGNVTYRSAGAGSCPDGQICKDCSGWTSLVLSCAGLTPGGGTSVMFSPMTNRVTSISKSGSGVIVNGSPLQDGDVIGWKAHDWSPETLDGHAMLYVGGSLYENHGGNGTQTGQGVRGNLPMTIYDEGGTFGQTFTGVYRPN